MGLIRVLMVMVIISANLSVSPSFWIFKLGIAIYIFSNMISVASSILRQQNSTDFAFSLYFRRTFSKVPSLIFKNNSSNLRSSFPWYYFPWDGASAIKKQQSIPSALNDSLGAPPLILRWHLLRCPFHLLPRAFQWMLQLSQYLYRNLKLQ